MRIFKNKAFTRFARKAGIDDTSLCKAVKAAERGLLGADLGGGVIKQRVARYGGDKSGGFRTLILFRIGSLAFFVHGFAKNEQANIDDDESALCRALENKTLTEVIFDKKQYHSRLMASIHETVEGLHEAGVIDKRTLRGFDELCLTPPCSQKKSARYGYVSAQAKLSLRGI